MAASRQKGADLLLSPPLFHRMYSDEGLSAEIVGHSARTYFNGGFVEFPAIEASPAPASLDT